MQKIAFKNVTYRKPSYFPYEEEFPLSQKLTLNIPDSLGVCHMGYVKKE